MLSSVSLGANTLPFPSLVPKEDWFAGGGGESKALAKPSVAELISIMTETQPLALRLNQHGQDAARRCNPKTVKALREWDEYEPDFLLELFQLHVEINDQTPAPSERKRVKEAQGSVQGPIFSTKRQRRVDRKSGDEPMPSILPELLEMDDVMVLEESEDPKAALMRILNSIVAIGRASNSVQQVARELSVSSAAMLVEVSRMRALSLMEQVAPKLLSEAFSIMIQCIEECTKYLNTQDSDMGQGSLDISVEAMMRAVLVILSAASDKSVASGQTAVCTEAVLNVCVRFLETFLNKRVLSPMDALMAQQAQQRAETAKEKKSMHHDHMVALNETASKAAPVCQGFNFLNDVVRYCPVQDKEVLRMTEICMSSFFHDGAEHLHMLQNAAIPLMQTIFARFAANRQNTLMEIFVRIGTWQYVSRKERCFKLAAPASGQIQMLSALLLSLFQACDICPSAAESGPQAQPVKLKLLFIFVRCFQKKFSEIEKAGKKVDRDMSQAHRLFFKSFCDDVCSVLGLPDFPIAPLAARIIWKVGYDISQQDTCHMSYRTMASDRLGEVVVAIKRHMMLLPQFISDIKSQNPYHTHIVSAIDTASLWSADSHDSLMRGKTGDTTKIDVASTAQGLLEQQQSALKRAGLENLGRELRTEWDVNNERNGKGVLGARIRVHGIYCKQMLLNYLDACTHKDQNVEYTRQAFISDWCEEEGASISLIACWRSQWMLPSEGLSNKAHVPSPAEAAEIARFLAMMSTIQKGFQGLLTPVLKLLGDPKLPIFRQKSLKSLSRIVDLDPETLSVEGVQDAVCSLMTDSAKSVRAAAVQLVGNYMCLNSEVMDKYFHSICQRCRDTGSSVRKTAMIILKDCLAKENLDQSLVECACVAMVPLLKDESQDIRNRAAALLKSMWFPVSTVSQGKRSEFSSSFDSKHGVLSEGQRCQNAGDQVSLPARFNQIKGVVNAALQSASKERDGTTVLDMLEIFFREAMMEDPAKERACKDYCEHGIQCVIKEHEDLAGTNHAGELDKILLKLFRTLALFAKAKPDLMTKQAHLLHQYLTTPEDNSLQWTKDQCQLTGTVATIYDCVLPYISPLPLQTIKYLQEDLPQLVRYAPSMQLVIGSVRCLCTLVRSVGVSLPLKAKEMMLLLARVFQQQTATLQNTHPTAERSKGRALIIAGMISRYSHFRLTVLGAGGVTTITTAISEENVSALFETCCSKFARHATISFRRAGYHCLGSLFIRQPTLILKDASASLIDAGLGPGEHDEVRSEVLGALLDFVVAGEEKSEMDVDDEDVKGASCVRNTVMQKYLQRILDCAYSKSQEVAEAALKLVSHIYKGGQVHPKLCIPDLIAVQQRGQNCANIALMDLRSIVEKYPVYFTPEVFVEGVLKAFQLHRQDQDIMVHIFARTFELRSSDKAFVKRVIGHGLEKIKQEPPASDVGDQQRLLHSLRIKRFLLTVLASLPLAHDEHVALILTGTGEAGVELGTSCLASLEGLINESGDMLDISDVDPLIEEASRSHMLLEAKRFLFHNYKTSKASSLPIELPPCEITVLMQPDPSDALQAAEECCRKLSHSLRTDSIEESRASRKRVGCKGRAEIRAIDGSDECDDEEEAADSPRNLAGLRGSGVAARAPRASRSKRTLKSRTLAVEAQNAVDVLEQEDVDMNGLDDDSSSEWDSDEEWM